MLFIISPDVDADIRYEWGKTKNMTVCVKDVLYVIAIVLVVLPWGLYSRLAILPASTARARAVTVATRARWKRPLDAHWNGGSPMV